MTKVESIKESDAEVLVELFSHAGPFVRARTRSDYWLYARLFSTTCLCIRDDSAKAIAALIAFKDQTPGKREIYIQDVVVSTEHRRRSYGFALMNHLHETADEAGIQRIWLTSEHDNSAALSLWKRLGYENLQTSRKERGVWITLDLKGPGKHRAIYERFSSQG